MIKLINNILSFFTDPKNTRMILLGCIVILAVLLLRQCESTSKAKSETVRIKNNQIALKDTVRNYRDKWGNSIGEIRGLKLKVEELGDSVELAKDKQPITIVKTETEIVEKIVEIPTESVDTIVGDYNSAIKFSDTKNWGKSYRQLDATVPYKISNDTVIYGSAAVKLTQNIWLSAQISQDTKTEEIFVNLKTDYPGVKFNNASGIMIDKSSNSFKRIRKKSRKTLGMGLHIGIGHTGNGISPYVGIGLSYTPKFLQW